MLDTTSGVMQSATGTLKNAWSATGPQFSQHIADISKGVLIIVVGGLACGVGLSLVRSSTVVVAVSCRGGRHGSESCFADVV
jgi:ABC-type uncharacterized transport system permease subunit